MTLRLCKQMAAKSLAAGALAAMLTTGFGTAPAQATCVPEPYIGSICITAATFCPREYAELTGQTLTIIDFSALYSLMGNLYGGDGRDTFALPDTRGRSIVGRNTQQLSDGRSFFGTGMVRGNEQIVLTEAQMPSHSHSAVFAPGIGGGGGSPAQVNVSTQPGTSNVWSPATPNLGAVNSADLGVNIPLYTADTPTEPLGGVSGGGGSGGVTGTVTVAHAGSNDTINILPPQIALKYCIAISGLYPPRS